jgi:hypothetical protein
MKVLDGLKSAFAFLLERWFTVFLFLAVVALIAIELFRPANNGVVKATDPSQLVNQPAISAPGNSTGISAPVPTGTTTFCIRLDGRENGHLPALMGSAAQNAYANGLNGSNWSLPATSSGSEPYGVTADGKIFAKVSFLKQYGMVSFAEVKCDATGWMAEKMTVATIGGEEALVFQLK